VINRLFLFFSIVIYYPVFGQSKIFQFWSEMGVQGKINKKLDWNVSLTNRFHDLNLVTTFPQMSFKYKLVDWFKPSMDYRFIANREENGNYTNNHRLNLNLQLEKEIKRVSLGFRFRYQYSFKGLTMNYEPEFDNAIRLKPSLVYDVKGSVFSPVLSSEFFYNPSSGLYGKRYTRIRSFAGIDINFKGPHGLQVGYFFDKRINLPRLENRHVISLEYTYNISRKTKKKESN
jgi:hypothetical protein